MSLCLNGVELHTSRPDQNIVKMEPPRLALIMLLFVIYYFVFAKTFIDKFKRGGVITTKHQIKSKAIEPPGLDINQKYFIHSKI